MDKRALIDRLIDDATATYAEAFKRLEDTPVCRACATDDHDWRDLGPVKCCDCCQEYRQAT